MELWILGRIPCQTLHKEGMMKEQIRRSEELTKQCVEIANSLLGLVKVQPKSPLAVYERDIYKHLFLLGIRRV